MPAPEAEAVAVTVKTFFRDRGIHLPEDWTSKGYQYPHAFQPIELSTQLNAQDSVFHDQTANKYHTHTVGDLDRRYQKFFDGLIEPLCNGWDNMMKNTSIVTVELAGLVGTVLPGATIGTPIKDFIMAEVPQETELERRYSEAVVTAISNRMEAWYQGLTGILTFTPAGGVLINIPQPLMTFSSEDDINFTPEQLVKDMLAILDQPDAKHAQVMFVAFAEGIFSHFQEFKLTSQVMGVTMTMGAPIPEAPEDESEAEEDNGEDIEEEEEEEETEVADEEDVAEGEALKEALQEKIAAGLEQEGDEADLAGLMETAIEEMAAELPPGTVIPTLGNFV